MTSIYFLRHAEAHTTVQGLCAGLQTPCRGLTDYGRDQVERIRHFLPETVTPPAAIYVSPIARAIQTAQVLVNHYAVPETIMPSLRERDYGDWEGALFSTLQDRLAAGESPPGGETHIDFGLRAQTTIQTILKAHRRDAAVWVVSHGGFWQALHDAMSCPAPWIHPGDIYRLDAETLWGGVLKADLVFTAR